jgi:hypothetical protein
MDFLRPVPQNSADGTKEHTLFACVVETPSTVTSGAMPSCQSDVQRSGNKVRRTNSIVLVGNATVN